MKLDRATPAIIRGIWDQRSAAIPKRPYVGDVAAALVNGLFEQFEDSLVLARAFFTVPYASLPQRQRTFALALARSVKAEHDLTPRTPVHCLIATRGRLPAWNCASESHGHIAIPLLSESFVHSIPMMASLLKDLGLPLAWVQDPGAALGRAVLGSQVGCFWVEDAVTAVDELGRKIIPAIDFVNEHSVRSVFAVGGAVFGGGVFTVISFTRDPVAARTARAFMPLVNHVKEYLVPHCSMARVFRPEGEGAGGPSDSEADR